MVDNYYKTKMNKKILEEINRYREINRYNGLLNEQEALPPTGDALPPVEGGLPPMPEAPATQAPMTEPESTEELDITDLVNMIKSTKNDIKKSTKDNTDDVAKMDSIFNKLADLENKLGEMDTIINRIDQLGNEVQEIKPKTPEEKLEMRSLDSYPFNEKPKEFFNHKQAEMRATGKNEYVLTKDDVMNYSSNQIMNSFNPNNNYETQF